MNINPNRFTRLKSSKTDKLKENYIFLRNESIDLLKWQELVQNSRYANPFQLPQFYGFCNSTPNHRGFAGAVVGENKEYYALCVADIIQERGLTSYFSRRAIIYGGPLMSEDCQEQALAFLLENLHQELKDKVIYIEIRNFKDYSGFRAVYTQKEWQYIPYQNVRNNLCNKNLNDLLGEFKYSRRREIKLTVEAGLSYQETQNEKDIKEIYSILKDIYKRRTGLPLPSLQYFIDFNKTGLLKVFKVEDQGVIVGGSFCVVLDKEGIYTFYYCGIRDYKPNVFPTHLAVLAAMEYGIKNDLKYVDFMGAGKPGTEYGVRNYKLGFGGDLVEEGRYLKVENKLLYRMGTRVIDFRKRRVQK